MAKKIKHFLRSCTHPLIILSKNDPGMTWNATSSSFPVRTGMASEWLKNDLKCQFSSFPGMIGMTLEWLRNDWKCHFSSFLGMIGMTSEWWFDSFNAHSYHSCHSWFFCAIPSFQPHSAIQNSFQNDEQWGKWGMTSNEWPNLTTFPLKIIFKQFDRSDSKGTFQQTKLGVFFVFFDDAMVLGVHISLIGHIW